MTTNNEDMSTLKAARGTKVGFVKLVFNFLMDQDLFSEMGGRYYAKDRFRALVENYYEESRGRLYEIAAASSGIAAGNPESIGPEIPQREEETHASH